MRIILLSLSLLLSAVVSAQDIQPFIRQQMALYPKSHLLDIYKSCFQDYMGAEHLVSDRERAKAYLDEELNTTEIESLPQWYYEPCGTKGRYIRVSLRTVKEGLITEDMLLDAFIRSANAKRPSVKSWRRKWHKIIGTIDKMNLNLPDYDREKQFIDSILSVGKYAISHSSDYREAYHPHYRIVERRIFENELKPECQGDKQEKSMSITVNLRYTGTDGNARKFVEEMVSSGTVDAIRAEEGNLRYEYYQSLDDPETILLIDSWANQEAIDKHHATPMMDTIAKLREKYDLHMTVERYTSAETPEAENQFIRK